MKRVLSYGLRPACPLRRALADESRDDWRDAPRPRNGQNLRHGHRNRPQRRATSSCHTPSQDLAPMNELDAVARRQHGLVTGVQLEQLDWSSDRVRHAVRVGRLLWVRPRVYRLAGAAVTKEQSWLAAVLAAGAGVVLSHESAARLYRLLGFFDGTAIDLLTTAATRPRLEGIRAHRTNFLPPQHVTTHRHIPVTSVARTLIDACGAVPLGVLESAVDDALRRQILSIRDLVRAVELVPPGRRKLSPIKHVLEERVSNFHPGESPREVDVLRVIRRAGLPLPVPQYRVAVDGKTYRIDFAWPHSLHGLEYEGHAFHSSSSASAFHGDRARTRALQRAGWTLWPLTARTSEAEIVAIAREATALPQFDFRNGQNLAS